MLTLYNQEFVGLKFDEFLSDIFESKKFKSSYAEYFTQVMTRNTEFESKSKISKILKPELKANRKPRFLAWLIA